MKVTIYIDILIITNIIINYFLVKITAVVSGTYAETKRLIASSVTGALFSAAIFFDIPIMQSALIKLLSVSLCVFIAFGYGGKFIFLKNILSFIAANLALSGFIFFIAQKTEIIYINNYMFYIYLNPVLLVACILSIYILLTLYDFVFSSPKNRLYRVIIEFNNNEHCLTGFYDTGFGLKDIILHRALIMCDYDTVKNIVDKELSEQIYNFFIDGTYENNSIIPVFYGDISNKGILPSIKPDNVFIMKNGKRKELKNTAIVVCRQKLSEEYQIIFGKEIFNRIGN